MARETPFLIVLETTLSANGTGSVSYAVPPSEDLEIADILFVSSGTFNITGIRSSDGLSYTNASASIEIPSSILQNTANANNVLKSLFGNLGIMGSITLYIDLEDSSGSSNTITLVLSARRMLKV